MSRSNRADWTLSNSVSQIFFHKSCKLTNPNRPANGCFFFCACLHGGFVESRCALPMTYMKEIPFPDASGVSKGISQKVLTSATTCFHCGSSGAAFLCSRCRTRRFCSPGCQQSAWKEHRKECGREDGPQAVRKEGQAESSEKWVVVFNTDSFPGSDAGTVTSGLEAAKEACMKNAFGGMVAWQKTCFLRKESVPELVAAMTFAQGTHLWLPIAPLLEVSKSKSRSLCQSLPEVIVPGAKAVRKCSNLSVAEMDENFEHSRPVVLRDAQSGWAARSVPAVELTRQVVTALFVFDGFELTTRAKTIARRTRRRRRRRKRKIKKNVDHHPPQPLPRQVDVWMVCFQLWWWVDAL